MTRVSGSLLDIDIAAMSKMDVEDFPNIAAFPLSGEFSKIYVNKDNNECHRWDGSGYVLVGSSLILGELAENAYRGDRGKIAYDHSQQPHPLADAEKNVQSDWAETSALSDTFIQNKPSEFNPSAHTHDDRYFTETEMNSKLALKSDVTYTDIELAKKVDVTAYTAKITEIEGDIDALETGKVDLSVYNAKVTNLESVDAGLQTSKADKSYVDGELALKVAIVDYNATVTTINNAMDALDAAKVAKTDYNAKMTTIDSDISDLEADKAELSYVNTELAKKLNITQYNTDQAAVAADIAALQGASATEVDLIAGLALKVDKTTYNAKVAALESDIDNLDSTKADITYVDAEVAAVESNVANLTSVKADITYVDAQDALKQDKTTSAARVLVVDAALQNLDDIKVNITDNDAAMALKADLVGGLVPNSQLPSYVDDVKVYPTQAAFPATGENDKVYVAEDNNSTFRWSGSAYVIIGSDLAIGETSSTAYRGDRGKIAYDHSQVPHSPADAEKNVQGDWTETDTNVDAFIKNKPAAFNPVPHIHDDRYYTEDEMDTALALKANAAATTAAIADLEARKATIIYTDAELAKKVDVTAYDTEVASLQADITALESSRATTVALNAGLDLKVDQTDYDTKTAALDAVDAGLQTTKADLTYVNAQLATKVDQSAYDTKMLAMDATHNDIATNKADLSYTNAQLALKADITYVDTQIGTLSTGKADLSYVNTELAKKVDNVTYDAKVATIEANITTLGTVKADKTYVDTQLATKVDNTTYVSKIGTIETDIGDLQDDKQDKTTSAARVLVVDAALNGLTNDKLDKTTHNARVTVVDAALADLQNDSATSADVTAALALKADLTYVDNADAQLENQITAVAAAKADLVYTDAQLALKVDVTENVAAMALKADLVDGLIPTAQLPGYVDDVLAFASVINFPATGESGKVYIDESTNVTYRWAGSSYVKIGSDLALGETAGTAYRGDRGKVAYDHSLLVAGNPHAVTKAEVGLGLADNVADADKPISIATQGALDNKADLVDGQVPYEQVSDDVKVITRHEDYDLPAGEVVIPLTLFQIDAAQQNFAIYSDGVYQHAAVPCDALGVEVTSGMTSYVKVAESYGDILPVRVINIASYMINDVEAIATRATFQADRAQTIADDLANTQLGGKLDVVVYNTKMTEIDGDIDALQTGKADKTYVDTQLSTRVAASVYDTAMLAKADLVGGKIPTAQLPGFVDDVLAFGTQAGFPATGESGKIYIAEDTNITYRWGGSAYVPIGSDLALGETSATAYRGDHGKAAYDHSLEAHAPANAEENVQADWDAPSGDAAILNKPATFPPSAHDHDSVYYTQSEVDTELATKSDASFVTTALAAKADKAAYDAYVATTDGAISSLQSSKADLTFVSTSLAAKANLTYVDAEIQTVTDAIVAAEAAHATKAELTAGLANKADDTATTAALATKADLVGGLVPTNQLPGYVDDVLSFSSVAAFPGTGETGKIYVDTTSNKTYRWGGSSYVIIGSDLAIGSTAATAFRGDYGQTAYDHSIAAHAPANAEENVQADWNETVGDAAILNKPTVFTPDTHTHTPTEVGLGTLPNAKSDAVNVNSSNQLATSTAVKTAYDRGNAAYSLAGTKADSAHTHDTIYPRLNTAETITGAWTFTQAVTSSVDFIVTSDSRLKDNQELIGEAVVKIEAIGGYTYDRNDLPDEGKMAGVIAQQVEAVLPEAVVTDAETGMKSVKYNAVVALLVESVKELSARIKVLEAK